MTYFLVGMGVYCCVVMVVACVWILWDMWRNR